MKLKKNIRIPYYMLEHFGLACTFCRFTLVYCVLRNSISTMHIRPLGISSRVEYHHGKWWMTDARTIERRNTEFHLLPCAVDWKLIAQLRLVTPSGQFIVAHTQTHNWIIIIIDRTCFNDGLNKEKTKKRSPFELFENKQNNNALSCLAMNSTTNIWTEQAITRKCQWEKR